MSSSTTKHWRFRLHEIIYESNTPAGKAFDVALLFAIFTSIIIIMLDSVESIHKEYGESEGHDSDVLFCKYCGSIALFLNQTILAIGVSLKK